MRKHRRRLERQRRGVRTTRLRRPPQALSSEAPSASTASHPNVRDDGQRPSQRAEDGAKQRTDLVLKETKIFLQTRMDRQITGSRRSSSSALMRLRTQPGRRVRSESARCGKRDVTASKVSIACCPCPFRSPALRRRCSVRHVYTYLLGNQQRKRVPNQR